MNSELWTQLIVAVPAACVVLLMALAFMKHLKQRDERDVADRLQTWEQTKALSDNCHRNTQEGYAVQRESHEVIREVSRQMSIVSTALLKMNGSHQGR